MKKMLLFVTALCLSSLSFAQVLVATLQHGDSIRVFYHANAFVDAYNAATTGDVISLSAGSFTPCTINKDSLTIRGVGSNGSHPTVFALNFTLGNYDNNCHHITMEGIYCGGTVSISGSMTVYFQDVYFGALSDYSNRTLTGQLVNCRIGTYHSYSSWAPTLINCIVGDVNNDSQSSFVNCVVLDNQFGTYYDNVSLISSIIVYTGSQNLASSSSCQLPATAYAENCICVKTNSSVTGNLFARCVNNNSTMATPAVFSNFNLDAMNPERYVLTDSAQAAYPGSDSTQIGLYGGYMPYSTSSTYPVISRLNVAHQTTADGQLSVDIQVGYRQESEDNE